MQLTLEQHRGSPACNLSSPSIPTVPPHLCVHQPQTLWSCAVLCLVDLAVSDSATPWTVAHQSPLSMGFSRQVYFLDSPGNGKWVAISTSKVSSQPRDRTHLLTTTISEVSCIGRRVLCHWHHWEALIVL